jgi:hypothetical protein
MSLRRFDLVLTIAIALVIGVLGALGMVSATVTGGATLTTLGLLALSSLHSRTALANLNRTVTQFDRDMNQAGSADHLLGRSTSGVDLDLGAAGDISILGVTLARTVRNQYAGLCRRLEQGATVRIALIAPHPATIAEAARRSTIADSPEVFEHRLRPTMDLLDDLAERAAAGPGRLQIRLLDFVPAFGMVALDPELPHGQIHVDVYSHRSGNPEPTLPLYANRDPHWLRHFVAEFNEIWATGHPYGQPSTGSVPAGGGQHLLGPGQNPVTVIEPQSVTDSGDRSFRRAP